MEYKIWTLSIEQFSNCKGTYILHCKIYIVLVFYWSRQIKKMNFQNSLCEHIQLAKTFNQKKKKEKVVVGKMYKFLLFRLRKIFKNCTSCSTLKKKINFFYLIRKASFLFKARFFVVNRRYPLSTIYSAIFNFRIKQKLNNKTKKISYQIYLSLLCNIHLL